MRPIWTKPGPLCTLQEVADKMGITRQGVEQQEKSAFKKIRKALERAERLERRTTRSRKR